MGWLAIVTAIGTLLYWLNFFLMGTVHVVNEDWYLKFERAFPVADGWMAICTLLAGIEFLRGSPYARRFALLAGSSMVFLALLDISFNVDNRLYAHTLTSSAMATEAAINVWTLLFGAVLIAVGWQVRPASMPTSPKQL
jgi:hypothetical protein